jgi:hypothetical protein
MNNTGNLNSPLSLRFTYRRQGDKLRGGRLAWRGGVLNKMRYNVDKYKNIWYVLVVNPQESFMSRSSPQRGRSQKAPLGIMLSGGVALNSDALQRMGPQGVDSLFQVLSNADPDGLLSPPPNTEPKEE